MKCTATSKGTGKPCRLDAISGATVCHKHGGSAPQVKAKAADRLLDQQARRMLAAVDAAPVADPLSELARLTGQAIAFKDRLAEMVNALSGEPACCPECGAEVAAFGGELRYQDYKGSEQLRSEVALWERALDRCERFCSAMAKLDIDSRLAAIEERQAEAVLAAIDAALDAVGVGRDQRPAAHKAAAHRLALVG